MSGYLPAIGPDGVIETPHDIVRRVAVAHRLTFEDLRGRSRRPRHVAARRDALAVLLDTYPNASLPQLGRWMGKHHTTVFDALRAMGRGTVGMARNAARSPRRLPPPRSVTLQSVIAQVARRRGIPARILTGTDVTRPVAHARWEAMAAVADAFPEMQPGAVAALFGRERTTFVRARIALAQRHARSASHQTETRPC